MFFQTHLQVALIIETRNRDSEVIADIPQMTGIFKFLGDLL